MAIERIDLFLQPPVFFELRVDFLRRRFPQRAQSFRFKAEIRELAFNLSERGACRRTFAWRGPCPTRGADSILRERSFPFDPTAVAGRCSPDFPRFGWRLVLCIELGLTPDCEVRRHQCCWGAVVGWVAQS